MQEHRTISRRAMLSGSAALAAGTAIGARQSRTFAVPAVLQGQTEITYWHINSDTFGGPATAEIVANFEAANPDIKVTQLFQQNSYTGLLENLQASLVAGTAPDIAQIGYLFLDYVYNNLPYVPLDTLVETYDSQAFIDGFVPNILELASTRGIMMGTPFAVSAPMVYFNADLLAEAGLDPASPPVTTEDWTAASAAIKDTNGKVGITIQLLNDNWTLDGLMESNGQPLLHCGDGAVAVFDQPLAVEALQWWADLCANDYSLNVLAAEAQPAFLAGETAAYITTPAQRAGMQEQATFDLRATQFPRFGDNELSLPTGGNTLVTFSQDEAKQEAAWRFIQHLYSPESMNLWIQGTGYLPPREDATAEGTELAAFVGENAIQAVATSQVPYARRWITFPGANGIEAQQSLFEASQAALGGQKPAQDALTESAARVNELIAGESCV
ncbi:MAG: ABC transporter substrate-binding protein [Thermomicrobiales bacterium]|nr:ABC transporter substrate-binding protein [Thermomicrobiales bacterium]